MPPWRSWGDPLPKLDEMVNWNGFRPISRKIRKKRDPSKGGRPPFDEVLKLNQA